MDPAAHAGQAVRGPKQKAPQYRACGATMRAADSDVPEQAFPATSLPVPISWFWCFDVRPGQPARELTGCQLT